MEQHSPLIGRDRILREAQEALVSGSVIILGEMGVGKTRMAQEIVEHHRRNGWRVETVMATPSTRSIPFGAFVHLVPALPAGDLFLMLAKASSVISRLGGRRQPMLLLVEDAHDLDTGSEALLEKLIREGSIRVVVTMRPSGRSPDLLTTLRKEASTLVLEVPPLTQSQTATLVESITSRLPDRSFLQSLWTLAEGNPLFVTEIVDNARISGTLIEVGEEVTVSDPLVPSTRVSELIRVRLGNLEPEHRKTLDLISVIEPVPLYLLSHLVDLERIDRLVDQHLLRLDVMTEGERVQSAHPLYGEVLRSTMTRQRRKEIAESAARALLEEDAAGSGAAMFAAVWLLDAGIEPESALALVAAEEALAKGDPALAERLGRIGLRATESIRALVTVGSALSVRGETEEAGGTLARAMELAEGAELAEAGLAYSRHLLWMEHRFEESVELLNDVADRIGPEESSLVRVEQAMWLASQGSMQRALETVEAVLVDDDANESATLGALVWSTLIRVMLGRFEGLEADLERAQALAEGNEAVTPLVLDQIGSNRLMREMCVDLAQASNIAVEGERLSLERGGAVLIWTVCRSWVELAQGDVEQALHTTRRALQDAETFDPFGNRAMTLCTRALALAHAARMTEAARMLGQFDRHSLEPRTRVWFDRAHLWATPFVASADLARVDVNEAVEDAREAGLNMWAAELAFDAVRLGEPNESVAALRELASDVSERSMVSLYADAAEATVHKDVDSLIETADDLLARHARLSALELTVLASSFVWGPDAYRLKTRAFELLRSCPGAQPPILAHVEHPLTEREREVARLAARGGTSRDIASRLFVSVRTVENHLARTYKKLNLGGREELPTWFLPGPQGPIA